MERSIPYHSSYQLGRHIDVTKLLSQTGTQLIAKDVQPIISEPNFTTAQFSFVESMKDACDVLGIPPEYALKVQTQFFKNPVVHQSLTDIYEQNSVKVVFRITFLQRKVYLPYEEKSSAVLDVKTADHEVKESGKPEEEVLNASSSVEGQTEVPHTHVVSALEIGNELVVILKIATPDHESFHKVQSKLRETLQSSRGIINQGTISALETFATNWDKKMKKKSYADMQCSIHYGCFSDLEKYHSDLTGMVKVMKQFIDRCEGWVNLFRSEVSPKVADGNMMLKEGVETEKKGIIQAAINYISSNKDESETTLKDPHMAYEFHAGSDVDTEGDSFVVLASAEGDQMYRMKATIQSDEPEDAEIETLTSFALSQYPETARERFEKMNHLVLQIHQAISKLQDLFNSRHFLCEDRQVEGNQILASVQSIHLEINEAIEQLDMINMPSEEVVESIYSSNPLQTVNDYIENVMSKLTPGCDLDLLLIGKTGHGKSSTGNSILGMKKFATSASAQSVTKSSNVAWANVDGRILKVVDTPGVCDTVDEHNTIDVAIHAMSEAITHCPGGFHALLLVIRFGQRMTTEEKKAIGMLKCILGEKVIETHCICVITHGDDFETEMEEQAEKLSFQEWCQSRADGYLKDILKECQFRCVLFNNKTKDPKIAKGQLIQLISTVDSLKTRGTRYTNTLFEFARQEREAIMARDNKPMVSHEMMRDIELVLDHLKSVAKNTEERDKYVSELENLRGMVDNLSNRMAEVEGEQVKLLVETVFSLATVIHSEIEMIADTTQSQNEVVGEGTSSGNGNANGNEAGVQENLQTAASNLQSVWDNQVTDDSKDVDREVENKVADKIKEEKNCFPATCVVFLRSGATKTMEELEVGEEVLVRNGSGKLCFDTVYMFGHKDANVHVEFIVLHVEDKAVIMSEDHLVFCRRKGSEMCLPARKITSGDELLVVSNDSQLTTKPVLRITKAYRRGLFAPFTMSGTIVVDGAVMSCYVDVFPHAKAHALLSLMRQLYRISPSFLALVNGTKTGHVIPPWGKMVLKLVGNGSVS